ncbi:MAG: hypothetical protein K2N73_03075 [Lachnospiraceae bacterium]|nr:hypothetical protein [Lachnospiraceae bacterium]
MRKAAIILAALIGSGWFAAGITGCQGDISSQKPEDYVSGVVSDIKTQAVEEIKKAFANEVEDFFKNDDLASSLGISSEEQGKLEKSIKDYISQYSQDEEKLSEAKEALDKLLDSAGEFSADELQDKISDIFQNKE